MSTTFDSASPSAHGMVPSLGINGGGHDDDNESTLSSLERLLQQERDKTEQLSHRILVLENEKSKLLDVVSDLKKKYLKQKLEEEKTSADARRKLASLHVELDTSERQVAYLEKETKEQKEALQRTMKVAEMNSSINSTSTNADADADADADAGRPTTNQEIATNYQIQIQVLIDDKTRLQQELHDMYERNNNQTKLLKRLESEMTTTKKHMETKITELQKALVEERTKKGSSIRLQQQHKHDTNRSPRSPSGSSLGSGFFGRGPKIGDTTSVNSSSTASADTPEIPAGIPFSDHAVSSREYRSTTEISSVAGGRRDRSRSTSHSPIRTQSTPMDFNTIRGSQRKLQPGRGNSRLARLDRSNMIRQHKDNQNMSLRELLQEKKREQSNGDANNNDDNKNVQQKMDPNMLPDGGAVQQVPQASFVDAIIKKKQEGHDGGFWGKLLGSSATNLIVGDIGSDPTVSSSRDHNCLNNGSLLTREIMFQIEENDRIQRELEKVKQAQQEARIIIEKEQRAKEKKLAQQNVKKLQNAVKWGVFTMFKPVTEDDENPDDDDDDDESNPTVASMDTTELRRLAAKRTEGLTDEDLVVDLNLPTQKSNSYNSETTKSSSESLDEQQIQMMKRISVVSALSIPESCFLETSNEDEDP